MAKFVPKEKMSKKARKELAAQQRATWTFSPITKKIESQKRYNRKKAQRLNRDDFSAVPFTLSMPPCRYTARQSA